MDLLIRVSDFELMHIEFDLKFEFFLWFVREERVMRFCVSAENSCFSLKRYY